MPVKDDLKKLEREFSEVINRNGLDALVGLPDHVIAEFVVTNIAALKTANKSLKDKGNANTN
ncbi:MAG: hypothetical protein KKF24_16420 [Gammaproteobacteria bacterium]|nr:hypothetical protein [Gammaproteobacteria bacterium]MBU1834271.1 hypothetical protein [Gammaproteobacteria bacterium]